MYPKWRKNVTLNLTDKREIVSQVNQVAANALSAVVADYRGISVAQMTELRKQARSNQVYLRVVRNTLLKRAVSGTEYECLADSFIGPTIIAFANEDPGAPARLLKDFSKEHEDFEIKALAVNGQMLAADKIDVLATLPTREEALTQLAVVTLAPVTKLVRTFNDVPGRAVRVVAAVRDQKQEAA